MDGRGPVGRSGTIRGAGNAIVPQVGAVFLPGGDGVAMSWREGRRPRSLEVGPRDLFCDDGRFDVQRRGEGIVFVAPSLGYTSRVFGPDEDVAIAREGLKVCRAMTRRES